MKTYADYEREYNEAIAPAQAGQLVAKKDLWISCKWEEDTGFSPFAPNAKQQLQELEKADKKLYQAVVNGMLPFFKTLEEQGKER
jgi:hypothetical protein